CVLCFFFFQAEDGIRDYKVTGVQTCALPIFELHAVGPNGRVRANIIAKDVVVHGKVDGNVQGHDRVELKKSAVLSGDISTQRIRSEERRVGKECRYQWWS